MKKSDITEINEKTPLSLFFNPHTAREIYSAVKLVNDLPASFLSKQPATTKTQESKIGAGRYERIPDPGIK